MEAKTSVFDHMGNKWLDPVAKDVRPISTIILDEQTKERLLQGVRGFLDSAAGHRQAYLFHGPPGTGKTCLTFSVAGCLGLDIYALNLFSIDDDGLKTLVAELPGRCIILFEDVDLIRSVGTISPSTLLDVVDGAGGSHVVIMTTRHIERVDGALIRSVDAGTEFRLADKTTITRLFSLAFEDNEAVERLAKQFAAKIPELEFSPAEVLSFLIEHRLSPQEAVDNTEAWMARVRSEREIMKGGA